MSTEIILVIHALTQWNVDGKRQGHVDTPLNDAGREMAQALADRLANESIDTIFTSDLRRAYETAQPLAVIKNLSIQTDKQLREARWREQVSGSQYPILSFPVEYEEDIDVRKRIVETLTGIAETHPNQRVLVVSHGGTVRRFVDHVRNISNAPISEYRGIRTALNCFRYDTGKWYCILLDDDRHLKAR